MSKLIWDASGDHIFETGVDHGVLYPKVGSAYPKGVAWNGLVSVSESPTGAEATAIYADNIKYLNLMSLEEFGATIEAYTYPDEFAECDGSVAVVDGVFINQQARKPFGMVFRTRVGNDAVGDSLGYKLHIIYGASASPSEKAYSTVNDSPEAITFSWEITTVPEATIDNTLRPISSIVIDSTKVDSAKLTALEAILFGSDGTPGGEASLPLPDAIITALSDG